MVVRFLLMPNCPSIQHLVFEPRPLLPLPRNWVGGNTKATKFAPPPPIVKGFLDGRL